MSVEKNSGNSEEKSKKKKKKSEHIQPSTTTDDTSSSSQPPAAESYPEVKKKKRKPKQKTSGDGGSDDASGAIVGIPDSTTSNAATAPSPSSLHQEDSPTDPIDIDFDELLDIWVEWWKNQNKTRLDLVNNIDFSGKKALAYKKTLKDELKKLEDEKENANFLQKGVLYIKQANSKIATYKSDLNDVSRVTKKWLKVEPTRPKSTTEFVSRPNQLPEKPTKMLKAVKGKVTYHKKESVTEEYVKDVTFSISGKISIGIPKIGLDFGIEGGVEYRKIKTTGESKEVTVGIEEEHLSNENDILVIEKTTQYEYLELVKISGHVVVCCANPLNPGERYDEKKEEKPFKWWAIPINVIFDDLRNKVDHQDLTPDLKKIIVSRFKIEGEVVSFTQTVIQEVTSTELRNIENPGVLNYRNNLVIKLKQVNNFHNQKIKIDRLFNRRLPVENCTDLSLQLVEKEKGVDKKYPVKIEDILNYAKSAKGKERWSMLIYGKPGEGKTTFVNMLINKWSLLNEKERSEYPFEWILQIPLKKLSNKTVEEIITEECFGIEYFIEMEALKKITLEDGKRLWWYQELTKLLNDGKILLILDGFDEAPKEQKDNLKNLIEKKYVIVTSRDYSHEEIENLRGSGIDKRTLIEGFSPQQKERYIKNYFKDKKGKPANYESDLAKFLESNDQDNFSHNPFMLEVICYTLVNDSTYVAPIALGNIAKNLYGELFDSLCLRYLSKFITIRETLEGGRVVENMDRAQIHEFCKFEIGAIEFFAFIFLREKSEDQRSKYLTWSREYLEAVVMGSNDQHTKIKEVEFANILLKFGVLGTYSIDRSSTAWDGGYYFNHAVFQDYFSARFLVSLLQKATQPEKIKEIYCFPHSWDAVKNFLAHEISSVQDYIILNKENESHNQVWEFIEDILVFYKDQKTLDEFRHLRSAVFIKPETYDDLKKALVELKGKGYEFQLESDSYRITIKNTKSIDEQRKLDRTLGALEIVFKSFIEKNGLNEKVKIELDDSTKQMTLLIYSNNSDVLSKIAIALKEASGSFLSQYDSSHRFFKWPKDKTASAAATTELGTRDGEETISCVMQ